jgi:uncharacterized protein
MDNIMQNQDIRRSFVAVMVLLAVFLLVKSINELKENKFIGREGVSNTIVVSGEGKVSATPDIATFSFSVTEENKEVKVAQDLVSKKISKILDALEEMGIEEKDINTLGYNIYPRYEYYTRQPVCADGWCPPSTGERTLVGYEVSQSVSVKLRNLDESGEVLNSLGGLSVDNLYGPTFEMENIDELRREARKMAIDDAKKKARELSRDLGVKLVKIVNFSEGGNYMMYSKYDMASTVMEAGMGGASPEIPVGESDISSNVQIVYEIK